jgi:hypothetical protein
MPRHRMTEESQAILKRIDTDWHSAIRTRNRATLGDMLRGRIPHWNVNDYTPFSLPIFVEDREVLLSSLPKRGSLRARFGLTPSIAGGIQQPLGWQSHLVSLPVDQRLGESDLERIAEAVAGEAARPA